MMSLLKDAESAKRMVGGFVHTGVKSVCGVGAEEPVLAPGGM